MKHMEKGKKQLVTPEKTTKEAPSATKNQKQSMENQTEDNFAMEEFDENSFDNYDDDDDDDDSGYYDDNHI